MKLGFWGLCVGVVMTLALALLFLLKRKVPGSVLFGVCLLFSASWLLFAASQVTVTQRMSSGVDESDDH